MKKVSLLQRFSLLSLAAFLIVGLALGEILTSSIEKSAIDRAKNETAQFVAAEVDRVFPGMDFSLPMTGPRYEDFQKGVSHLLFTPSIKRIKVWNLDRVVVWSDKRQLVGKQFPDDKELLVALNGTVSSKIISPGKPEAQTENRYLRLLELYVPIRSEHEGKVRAVLEIYQDLEYLDADTSRRKRILWISIVAAFSGIYFACFGIVWRASRRLTEQTLEIEKSEERNRALAQELTSLINNVPGIVYRGYRDWSLSFIGAEVEPVTGYPPNTFTSGAVGWKEIIHPDDMEQVKEAFRKADKEKSDTLRVEYRIRKKDGGIRWLADRRQLTYDTEGNFAHVDGLLLDITDRKRAEEEVRESSDRLRAIFQASPLPIVCIELDGTVKLWNRAAEVVFGWTEDEVVGRLLPFVPEDKMGEFHALLAQGQKGILNGVEVRRRRKDGSPVDISIWTSPLSDQKGNAAGIMAVIADITERKRAEEEIHKHEEYLRVALAASDMAVFNQDLDLRYSWMYQPQLGYTTEQVIGKRDAELLPPDLAQQATDLKRRVLETGVGTRGEVESKLNDKRICYDLVVEPLRNTAGQIVGITGASLDITERKLAAEVVKESEEKFRLIFDNASDGILLVDTESMKIEMGNRKICEMLGYSEEEILRLRISDIHPEKDLPDVLAGFQSGTKGEINMAMDIPMKRKDGSVFISDVATSLITFHGKQFQMGIFRDLTRERILQKQLQTAQKMEAVGILAGGIAHDFNNALTGIFGFAELVKLRLAGNERALSDVDEILRCAERAATLTRQLLTYARRQIIEPVNLSLNKVITDLMKLVSKVVGEHFEVRTFLAKDLPTIRADVGQIEQVIMNLVLNARDAMPGGGQILLETELVDLDAEYVRYHLYMKVGSYVVLTVSDTGVGMDQKTQERVFDPFFTTKGPEKGTGLGLAMVYGIVKQHNGFIHVYSEPGKGTTFKIYLSPVEAAPDVIISSKPSEIRGGTETILLADDDESVRMFVDRTLKDLGYTVLVARDGEDAVTVFRENRERISLALLDVVMPLKGGKKAYEEMHNVRADLKVIFMSGYTANAVHESFILIAGIPFLSKPFGPGALARKVREVLDA